MNGLRQMIWKEYRIVGPFIGLMLVLSLFGSFYILTGSINSSTRVGLLAFHIATVIAAALLMGVLMFAGEREFGAENLLRRLDIPPWQIWASKVIVAMCGLLVLVGCLFMINWLVIVSLRLMGDPRVTNAYLSSESMDFFWGPSLSVITALELGILFSCLTNRLLTALVGAVIALIILTITLSDSTLMQDVADLYFRWHWKYGVLIVILAGLDALVIQRWLTGRQLVGLSGWEWPSLQWNVVAYGHRLSPKWRFASRVLWCEVRQSGWSWMLLMLFAVVMEILFTWWGDMQIPSFSWVLIPFLLGVLCFYSEQNRSRPRFWYQRGATGFDFWLSKNAIWLLVLFSILFTVQMIQFAGQGGWAGSTRDTSSFWVRLSQASIPISEINLNSPWVIALVVFFATQKMMLMVSQIVLAILCTLGINFFWIMMIGQGVNYAEVSLWIVFTPVIIAYGYLSWMKTADLLADRNERFRFRWSMLLALPLAVLIGFIGFCSYRAYSVPLNRSLFGLAHLKLSEQETDAEFTQRYRSLCQEFVELESEHSEVERKWREEPRTPTSEDPTGESKLMALREKHWALRAPIAHQIMQLLEQQVDAGKPLLIETQVIENKRTVNTLDYHHLKSRILWASRYLPEELIGNHSAQKELRYLWDYDALYAKTLYEYRSFMSNENMARLFYNSRSTDKKSTGLIYHLYAEENSESLKELAIECKVRESNLPKLSDIVENKYAGTYQGLQNINSIALEKLKTALFPTPEQLNSTHQDNLLGEAMLVMPLMLPSEQEHFRRTLINTSNDVWSEARRLDALVLNDAVVGDSWKKIYVENGLQRFYFIDPNLWISYQHQSFLAFIETHQEYRFTQTVLALMAFQKRTGVYPKSLQELLPTELAELPIDPWTGLPFEYVPPDFNGELVRGEEQIPVKFPLLWSRGRWELDMEYAPTVEKPTRYILISQNRYRELIFNRLAQLKTGEELNVGTKVKENASFNDWSLNCELPMKN
ncbi:ABC transporter permease [Rubinisphaera italica]|uniref:Uncharacterized protein n=1 Tax=Rubinisphaera italica TaxID=2527969 RepID=A0A5C5XDM6_9PLAN|nr:hypothetical protein [Rubinisphaera italica]TWT60491.1 hypothetical protein Pan54_12050 [Rubinisphaera italica]